MSGSNGSTTLDTEQQEWFLRRYGVRYVGVQTNADMPSRKTRRAAAKQQKREKR